MPWKNISRDASSTSDAWTFDEDKNKILEGKLVSKKQTTTKFKEAQWLYVIQDNAGVPWTVWGKTALDRPMQSVKEGKKIRIEYLGIKRNPKTGNQYKNFNVELWTE